APRRDTTAHLRGPGAAPPPDPAPLLPPARPPLTYGGLLGQARALADTLHTLGYGRGDRLAVVLPNGPEMAAAFVGIAASAVCAPLNPADRAEGLQFALDDLRIQALVVPAGSDSPAVPAARERGIGVLELALEAGPAAGCFTLAGASRAGAPRRGWAAADELALLLHTSGTTGRPKIVPLTQRNLLCSAAHTRDSLALTAADRCLQVMPLFHIHGLIGALLASLVAGGSVVCTPGFHVERFGDWLATFQPTWYTAVPTIHQAALESAVRAGHQSVASTLRFIRSGSAALARPVAIGLERVYGVPVLETYGMT